MHNLWIFQDDDLVSTKCDWEMGREYLFLVLLDMEFTLDQLEDFEESWLHRSQLTIDVDLMWMRRDSISNCGKLVTTLIKKGLL